MSAPIGFLALIGSYSMYNQGRFVGAWEARGGVVISKQLKSGADESSDLYRYFGVRFYIETLTQSDLLRRLMGEPHVRSAYAKPVWRYEVTNRIDVRQASEFIVSHLEPGSRREEAQHMVNFCRAGASSEDRESAYALLSRRATGVQT